MNEQQKKKPRTDKLSTHKHHFQEHEKNNNMKSNQFIFVYLLSFVSLLFPNIHPFILDQNSIHSLHFNKFVGFIERR